MSDDPIGGDSAAANLISELLDEAMDLTARVLSDRVDMTASAGFVINRVCREGPLRLTSLALKEGISQPSMTQLVSRLERQGLVAKLSDPVDRRAALVSITERGMEVIEQRKRMRRDRLIGLLATLTADEKDILCLAGRVNFPVLRRLVRNADQVANAPAACPSPSAAMLATR